MFASMLSNSESSVFPSSPSSIIALCLIALPTCETDVCTFETVPMMIALRLSRASWSIAFSSGFRSHEKR